MALRERPRRAASHERSEDMNVQDLQLLELLDFDPREGLITFRDQRMLIQGAGAMGLLRKELIETLGVATTRRLLLRFGTPTGTTTR